MPSQPQRPNRGKLALVVLVLAGFSGLIYEVVWTRLLTLTFGVTVFAASAVLCAFMGGLVLGSFVSGRFADRHGSPARLLAGSQVALGLAGLGLPAVFAWLARLYVPICRALPVGSELVTLARFLLSALVLLGPAALIAAAFPLTTRLVVASPSRIGRSVALAYGLDTIGGVAGTIVAGFILLRYVGVSGSVRIAAGLNFAAGMLALLVPPPVRADPVHKAQDARRPLPPAPVLPPATVKVLVISFGASGAAALATEVLVIKALVHVIGTSIYAFTTMLASFLLGIGLGSLVCAALLRRRTPSVWWFALAEAGIGLLVVSLPLQLGLYPALKHVATSRLLPELLVEATISGAVLLAPTLLMGATLPLLVAALAPSMDRLGRTVGTLYSVNTLGGVVGVLLATFVLLPLAGFGVGMAVTGAVNLAVALVALHAGRDSHATRRILTAAAVLAGAIVLIPMAARSSFRPVVMQSLLTRFFRADEGQMLFYKEAPEGTVAVVRMPDPRVGSYEVLAVNGISEGGTDIESLRAWVLLPNLPFLLHADHGRAKDTLVCAFGLGITLGAVANQDSKSVTCVELVPEVVDAAPWFSAFNHDPQRNPKVKLQFEDARNFLLTTDRRFDVVVMDATHPKTGDSWILYTQECYQLVKRVLAPGGVFAQWVPMHNMAYSGYWSIVRTFLSVFPHASLWSPPGSSHSVLVATPEPTRIDFSYIARRLADPAISRNLSLAEMQDEYTLLSYFIMAEDRLAACAAPFALNTDDLPPVQFSFPPRSARRMPDQYYQVTAAMESPLAFLSDLGSPPAATARVDRISRACRASKLVRQGIALMAEQDPKATERAKALISEAYRLYPEDHDAQFLLGIAAPRLRVSMSGPVKPAAH